MPDPKPGDRVALWTTDDPPLFAGIFTIDDPFSGDLVLVGIDNEYLVASLETQLGYGGCNFQLNETLSDNYDPDTTLPGTYRALSIRSNEDKLGIFRIDIPELMRIRLRKLY